LPILRCSFNPHGQNIKISKIDFYDDIPSVLNKTCLQLSPCGGPFLAVRGCPFYIGTTANELILRAVYLMTIIAGACYIEVGC